MFGRTALRARCVAASLLVLCFVGGCERVPIRPTEPDGGNGVAKTRPAGRSPAPGSRKPEPQTPPDSEPSTGGTPGTPGPPDGPEPPGVPEPPSPSPAVPPEPGAM